jgi:yecA family protein
MTAAVQLDAPSLDAIIHELETASYQPAAALRCAVAFADQLAKPVIELVEKAASGALLLPKQQNLLFWGIHVLGVAGDKSLFRPLLRLIRLDREEFDPYLGDAVTETLPRVLISTFDGDATALFEACAEKSIDGFVRWGLFDAIARLTFDGAIPRATTIEFLARFERENLACPGDAAWEGWQDAVAHLGIEELFERVRATWQDGRSPTEPGDQEFLDELFAETEARPAGTSGMHAHRLRDPLDDPVRTLTWTAREKHVGRETKSPFGPDPAAEVALAPQELGWLEQFLNSARVPPGAMTLEQLDGFFCALAAGPSAPPSEFMPVVWDAGDDPGADFNPDFDDAEQADYVSNLLRRHSNTIALRLNRGYPHFPILQHEGEELKARYWASGFIRGIALRAQIWGARNDALISAFLNMVVALGTDEDHLTEAGIDLGMRETLVEALPTELVRLHHRWHGLADPFPPPATTRYEGKKIGRNEPCPCGSGKKFKRCCGSAEKQSFN